MSFVSEFKEFALKGNVVDLAVGIVIGAAFGKIVTSFVSDILMPPIGKLMGGLDFSNLFINLSDVRVTSLAEAKAAGIATINYGLFINSIIDFAIIALAIFIVIRYINRLQRGKPAADPTTKSCQYCQSAIPIKATRCPQCTSELR